MKWFSKLKAKVTPKEAPEVEEYRLKDKELERLSASFVSPDEKYIASLGNGYIMNYLANKSTKKGFAFITDKRVYFKGSCLNRVGKLLIKKNEEKSVDVKNITGSGYTYQRRWLGIIELIIVLLIPIAGILGSIFLCWFFDDLHYNYKYYLNEINDAKQVLILLDNPEITDSWVDSNGYDFTFETNDYTYYIETDYEDQDIKLELYKNDEREKKYYLNEFMHDTENVFQQIRGCEDVEEKIEILHNSIQKEIRKNSPFEIICKQIVNVSVRTILGGLLVTAFTSLTIFAFIRFKDYLLRRKTLFNIEYAGGCIVFNVSFYSKAEIDDFQKQLRRAKDMAEESTSLKTVTMDNPVDNTAPINSADDLRKYAELLKDGLITQEEYDAMKKKVLGL